MVGFFCLFFPTLTNSHDFNKKLPDMFNTRQILLLERQVRELKPVKSHKTIHQRSSTTQKGLKKSICVDDEILIVTVV